MKIIIDLDENLKEEEIVIKCKKMDKTIEKIHRAISNATSDKVQLSFFIDDVEYFFSESQVLFFETEGGFVHAHTKNKVYKVKWKLYQLEEILPKNFVRVSKSTIVNVSKIYAIKKNISSASLVKFHDSHKQIYVSRSYYKILKDRIEERKKENEL